MRDRDVKVNVTMGWTEDAAPWAQACVASGTARRIPTRCSRQVVARSPRQAFAAALRDLAAASTHERVMRKRVARYQKTGKRPRSHLALPRGRR